MKQAVILGTGSCLPEKVLTNHDLEKMVDTSDEWITTRTGIRERRVASKGEENYKLASRAANKALAMAGMAADELDMIVAATMTPHMLMPSCACFVQAEIGAERAFAYDINAACSGFIYGLDIVASYIVGRPEMKILLIGSETMSTRVNWQDRNTCILFGDGAGACIISGREGDSGIIGSNLFSDGRLWNLLYTHGPKSLNPELEQDGNNGSYIKMMGREVFKHAVGAMEKATLELLARHKVTADDIDLVVPHQANIRILNKLIDRLAIDREKVYINVDKYGNTSAASVPIALDEANRLGLIKKGSLVLTCAFGGGFTWGAVLIRW